MSTAGISFSGLASGLDSASIIKSLVALERRPIGLLQQKKSKFDQQAKLFGTLRTKLDKLQDMAKALKLQGKVLDYTATADTDNVVKLTAGDNAVPGTYEFKINKLAQSQTRASSSKANSAATYSNGTLSFNFGDSSQDFSVDVQGDATTPLTLDEIASQVNAKADGKIKAAVVYEGGSGGYRLTFTSGLEGADGAFTVTEASGYGTLNSLMAELNRGPNQADNSGTVVAAQNAELEINGLTVQRSSNTVNDIINGVTVQLIGETAGKKVKITVGTDLEKSSKKMQDFVDAYNDVLDFINEQSKVEVEQGTGGGSSQETKVTANALAGDSTLRAVRRRIRSVLSQTVGTGNQAYTMLAQIGIDADRDGHLKFDQSKFEEAVSDDAKAVTDIFSNKTSGIASSLMDTLDSFTDSVDGLIKSRTDGIGQVKRDIDQQIERMERRIGQFEQNLQRRYAALEQSIGAMESQRGALINLQFQP